MSAPFEALAIDADRLRLEVQLLEERVGRLLDRAAPTEPHTAQELEGLTVCLGRASRCLREVHVTLRWLHQHPEALARGSEK